MDWPLIRTLADMAAKDGYPVVRLYLASAAQRIPVDQRWDLMKNLLAQTADAADQNLPLMYWYAAEPLAARDPKRALELAIHAKIPQILPFMVRRIASAATPEAVTLLVEALDNADKTPVQLTFLQGINLALKGRRNFAMPTPWPKVFARLGASDIPEIRAQATALAVTFGDAAAFAQLRDELLAPNLSLPYRQQALATLLGAGDKELAPVLFKLLDDAGMRGAALRGLANYDHAGTPATILKVYPKLAVAEKRDAVNTLSSRPAYAHALLDAIAGRNGVKLAAAEVPADVIRQLRNLRDKELDRRIVEVWGIVRDTPAERAKLMAHYRKMLTRPPKTPPDVAVGRALYSKTCAQCHRLFGVGGTVGPDITGSNRANLDYLLENLLDPSAVIPKEYAASLIELASGRVITGIVKEQTGATVTVITANEVLTLPRAEIESLKETPQSMMPDDQLKPLSEHEVRSLIAYLQSPIQVPLLANKDNVKDFFNGKDLAGWDGDPKLWKVDNGEIIGRSPGIKHNEFLRSHMSVGDFRLALKVKLTPDSGNSGIQFRSDVLPGGDVKGPQADIGAGWWGKLYEEHGRGLLWDKSGEAHVKPGQWNDYAIEAKGSHVRTWINGKLCVDIEDAKLSRRGIIALQIHSGPAMEVRFKALQLEVTGE